MNAKMNANSKKGSFSLWYYLLIIFFIFFIIILLSGCNNFFDLSLGENSSNNSPTQQSALKSTLKATFNENLAENSNANLNENLNGNLNKNLNKNSQELFSDAPVFLFDSSKIKIIPVKPIDAIIRSNFLYQDMYGDLLVFGEFLNNSDSIKTNINFTYEFLDAYGKTLDFIKMPANVDYVLNGGFLPFCLIYDKKENYINIAALKIGVDYSSYNKRFYGLPIVSVENFYYEDKKLNIEGKVINLGQSDIEDLKVFGVFYNNKEQVVFFRQCFIQDSKMFKEQEQNFSLVLYLDSYLPEFTHYKFTATFRDTLKT